LLLLPAFHSQKMTLVEVALPVAIAEPDSAPARRIGVKQIKRRRVNTVSKPKSVVKLIQARCRSQAQTIRDQVEIERLRMIAKHAREQERLKAKFSIKAIRQGQNMLAGSLRSMQAKAVRGEQMITKLQGQLRAKRAKSSVRQEAAKNNKALQAYFKAAQEFGYMVKGGTNTKIPKRGTEEHAKIAERAKQLQVEIMAADQQWVSDQLAKVTVAMDALQKKRSLLLSAVNESSTAPSLLNGNSSETE
jgi:hypothetical protein